MHVIPVLYRNPVLCLMCTKADKCPHCSRCFCASWSSAGVSSLFKSVLSCFSSLLEVWEWSVRYSTSATFLSVYSLHCVSSLSVSNLFVIISEIGTASEKLGNKKKMHGFIYFVDLVFVFNNNLIWIDGIFMLVFIISNYFNLQTFSHVFVFIYIEIFTFHLMGLTTSIIILKKALFFY